MQDSSGMSNVQPKLLILYLYIRLLRKLRGDFLYILQTSYARSQARKQQMQRTCAGTLNASLTQMKKSCLCLEDVPSDLRSAITSLKDSTTHALSILILLLVSTVQCTATQLYAFKTRLLYCIMQTCYTPCKPHPTNNTPQTTPIKPHQ